MSLEYACLTTERANLTTASPTSHYFTTLGVERSAESMYEIQVFHFVRFVGDLRRRIRVFYSLYLFSISE